MRSFTIPSSIVLPKKNLLYFEGQWRFVYVLLRSPRRNDQEYSYRLSFLRVEEPINLQTATFYWELGGEPLTFDQLLSECGWRGQPCLRVCVYGAGKSPKRTWHPALEAFRLLGLSFVPEQQQQQQQQQQQKHTKHIRNDHQGAAAASAAIARGASRHQQASCRKKQLVCAPEHAAAESQQLALSTGVPATGSHLLPEHQDASAAAVNVAHVLLHGSSSTYRTSSLGSGGYADVTLLELVQGAPAAPQQLAMKVRKHGAPLQCLEREAEVLQLLQQCQGVIQYYGSHNSSLLLEYCSHGDVCGYCDWLLDQMQAEEAATNPAAAKARQARAVDRAIRYAAWCNGASSAATAAPSAAPGSAHNSAGRMREESHADAATSASTQILGPGALERAQLLEAPLRVLMAGAFLCLVALHHGLGICQHPGVVVTHNDLKPENLLVAADGSVRLADWGTGHVTGGGATLAAELPRAHSTWFAAPETVCGTANAVTLPKGDVWSLLQTHCSTLTMFDPFYFLAGDRDRLLELYSAPDAQAQLEQLLDTYYGPLLPPAALAFFKWGLQIDPKQRPSAAAVLAHPYMQGG